MKRIYLDKEANKLRLEADNAWDWSVSKDSTDHFAFRCPKCNLAAVITAIDWDVPWKEIRFSLYCPVCNILGTRKMIAPPDGYRPK